MISINVPSSCAAEIDYVVSVLFGEFLNIPYKLDISHRKDYEITLDNGNILIIRDTFFSGCGQEIAYLNKRNIPSLVEFVKNRFAPAENIPLIYGTKEFEVSKKKIRCGIDIFASVFFLLTRWEEYVIEARDKHGRFPPGESLPVRCNFLHRPVVNEYTGMLRNMLVFLGMKEKSAEDKFRIFPTHDVDFLTYPFFLRRLAGDILKRRDFKKAAKRLSYMLALKNPYLCFDFLMDMSERHNLTSRFYFTHRGKHKYDGNYALNSRLLLRQVKKIKDRGHIIGFHPGYYAHNNPELFAAEKKELEEQLGVKIEEGRHHYLRFEIPATWQTWDDAGMAVDSTLGFSHLEGFRCGTGNEFPVFNILTRKKLKLKERPLIVMDTTLHINRNLRIAESLAVINKYKDISKKYKMPFTILVHNSSFEEVEWQGWRELYEEIIKP
jgi:hypothetical protein